MTTFDPTYRLTPSEIIFLKGDQFVKTARLGFRLLDSETKVSTQDLARAVLSGALLTMEATGEIRLEVEEYKRLIGKGRRLKVTLLSETTAFPSPSLEAVLTEICRFQENSKDGANVKDMVWASLGKDDSQPWNKMLNSIPPHIAERGLLETVQEKKLKIFTVTNYTVPESTRSLADAGPVSELKALLSNCETERPELWKQMKKEIDQGIKARELDDDYD
jgi:hypothetical protein